MGAVPQVPSTFCFTQDPSWLRISPSRLGCLANEIAEICPSSSPTSLLLEIRAGPAGATVHLLFSWVPGTKHLRGSVCVSETVSLSVLLRLTLDSKNYILLPQPPKCPGPHHAQLHNSEVLL